MATRQGDFGSRRQFRFQPDETGMTVGVGWGRTLYNMLPFINGGTLDDFRVVSLLGGIAAARRFNPAEFAWQFANCSRARATHTATARRRQRRYQACASRTLRPGGDFEMADKLDVALLSVGGISTLTTSYRTAISVRPIAVRCRGGRGGRRALQFIDAEGDILNHEVNSR